MTRREMAALACKILALWLVAQFAFYVIGGVIMACIMLGWAFRREVQLDEYLTAGTPMLIGLSTLIVGLFLWFKSDGLAARMVADDATPVTRPDITQEGVMAVAFTAIGVFVLVPALRDLAGIVVLHASAGSRGIADVWRESTFWSSVLGIAIALWLILGARGIVRVVVWARGAAAKRGGESDSGEAG